MINMLDILTFTHEDILDLNKSLPRVNVLLTFISKTKTIGKQKHQLDLNNKQAKNEKVFVYKEYMN